MRLILITIMARYPIAREGRLTKQGIVEALFTERGEHRLIGTTSIAPYCRTATPGTVQ